MNLEDESRRRCVLKAVVTSTWADFRQYHGNQMQTVIQARPDDPDEPLGIVKVINKPGKSEKAKQQQNVCNLFLQFTQIQNVRGTMNKFC